MDTTHDDPPLYLLHLTAVQVGIVDAALEGVSAKRAIAHEFADLCGIVDQAKAAIAATPAMLGETAAPAAAAAPVAPVTTPPATPAEPAEDADPNISPGGSG